MKTELTPISQSKYSPRRRPAIRAWLALPIIAALGWVTLALGATYIAAVRASIAVIKWSGRTND